MKIRKAVIPVAGKGTRFLPATKQLPKEMLPIINTPMIFHVVKEAVDSGIEQIIFVTSSGKESLENFFDRNIELEDFLLKNNKEEYRSLIKSIGEMVEVISVRQKEQLGLGHAVLCAKNIIGNETFAVLLGDDLIVNEIPATKQLIDCSREQSSSSVIGVMEVENSQTNKYGIIDGEFVSGSQKTLLMKTMIEKPDPDKAPTNLATPGRYILHSDIFSALEEIPRGVGGEYQLTDAINLLAKSGNTFAHIFDGERFDTGSVTGYLDATVEFALRDEKLKNEMERIIVEKVKKYSLKV